MEAAGGFDVGESRPDELKAIFAIVGKGNVGKEGEEEELQEGFTGGDGVVDVVVVVLLLLLLLRDGGDLNPELLARAEGGGGGGRGEGRREVLLPAFEELGHAFQAVFDEGGVGGGRGGGRGIIVRSAWRGRDQVNGSSGEIKCRRQLSIPTHHILLQKSPRAIRFISGRSRNSSSLCF